MQPEDGLYCDGGVIGHNPSEIGGTWAFRIVEKSGSIKIERCGVIAPAMAQVGAVTNNVTEMLAMLYGLISVRENWCGVVYSDSQITIGRVSLGWKWKNIPDWTHKIYQAARKRLVNWDKIEFALLQGHPTKAELAQGIGKRGHPVSEHNVWCDQACGEIGRAYLEGLGMK